ncbi:MAG: hypothetical protein NVSMB3_06000 [Acidobacteriaceae bacterium]
MEFLPRTMGTRPRVAVEVRPEGIVAARAEGGAGVLAAVSRANLLEGALLPGLRAGNVAERAVVASAIRRALDGVWTKGGERSKYVTLVVPDAAVRVLLLDFDALPGKAAEALAVVRFRLKKLLPFDAEHAVVSYQVMSSGRDGVRVLAVAMPCDVLTEYEGLVTEAGYQPGAVLPSTLAALAGLDGAEAGSAPALVVNAGPGAVTTAIVQAGLLLLHRTVDLSSPGGPEPEPGHTAPLLAVADRFSDRAREPQSGGSSRPSPVDYDRMDAETSMQTDALRRESLVERRVSAMRQYAEGGPVDPGQTEAMPSPAEEAVQVLNETDPVSTGREITQAVSVAAAYFEDTLGGAPPVVLAAGTMGAERLAKVLQMFGMEGLRVQELVDGTAMGAGASASSTPAGWLAGVRGALRS